MEQRNITLLVLLATVIVASGCVSNNSTDNTNPAESPAENNSPQSSESTNTYTSGGENSTLKVVTNEDSQTYELSWETKENYSEAENSQLLNKEGMVNLTATVQCGLIQQMAYNYTGLQQSMEELEEEFGTANNTDTEESEIPQEVFEDYEATNVEGTVYNTDGSNRLATCNPTEENTNINLLVE